MSCEAISTHTVTTDKGGGTKVYEWSVTGDAYIKTGQGTATVTVGSLEENFTPFSLTCLVTDDTGNSIYTASFIHERTNDSVVHEDTFYIMNEPLVTANTTNDFMTNDTIGDGVFKDSSDMEWNPSSTEYPEDGTVELIDGKYLEMPHSFPSASSWFFVRCYNVEGANFDIMVIIYHGNNKASFMYGNESNEPALIEANVNLDYTPMAGNYKITGDLDIPTVEITYEMNEFIADNEITYPMDEFVTT